MQIIQVICHAYVSITRYPDLFAHDQQLDPQVAFPDDPDAHRHQFTVIKVKSNMSANDIRRWLVSTPEEARPRTPYHTAALRRRRCSWRGSGVGTGRLVFFTCSFSNSKLLQGRQIDGETGGVGVRRCELWSSIFRNTPSGDCRPATMKPWRADHNLTQ